jgi:hypothetical protein
MGIGPDRSGRLLVASLIVLVPDKDHVKEESRKGIKYHPVNARRVNYTPTPHGRPVDLHSGQTRGRYADGARRAGGIAPPLLRYRGKRATSWTI